MNKVLNFGIILITFLITSCSNKSEFNEFGVQAEKTVDEFVQIAPAGGINVTEYTFPAEIVTYHNDTLHVKARGQNPMVDIIIKVPGQGADGILPVGTIVDVAANHKKLGAPHLGWKYDVKYRESQVKNTKKKQDFNIPLKQGEFEKLVTYIETNGFVVTERGVSCDHQLTFFDKKGNRHALITIKRDENGQPSMNGTVDQISVWAYKDGVKDQQHFFGYGVFQDAVKPFVLPVGSETWPEQDIVQQAFAELIVKVN